MVGHHMLEAINLKVGHHTLVVASLVEVHRMLVISLVVEHHMQEAVVLKVEHRMLEAIVLKVEHRMLVASLKVEHYMLVVVTLVEVHHIMEDTSPKVGGHKFKGYHITLAIKVVYHIDLVMVELHITKEALHIVLVMVGTIMEHRTLVAKDNLALANRFTVMVPNINMHYLTLTCRMLTLHFKY
jgi:hypothetical protein